MEKKKKNNDAVIVWGVILVVALFLAYNFGLALTDKYEADVAAGMTAEEIKEENFLNNAEVIFEYFEQELTTVSLKRVIYNDYIKKSLLFTGFVWFVVVVSIYSDQKNLITNKEYGTARWGKESDIRDCFASTIMQKEIEQAKKSKTFFGMKAEEKSARAMSRMYAKEIKKQELLNLDLWYEHELALITNDDSASAKKK